MLGMNIAGCTAATCQTMMSMKTSAVTTIKVYQMATMLEASLVSAAIGVAIFAF